MTQNLRCVLRAQKTCNSMVRFLKYVVMLIFLKEILILDYNQFCS